MELVEFRKEKIVGREKLVNRILFTFIRNFRNTLLSLSARKAEIKIREEEDHSIASMSKSNRRNTE